MSFTDYVFLPLVIISVIVYHVLPMRGRWIWLLGISVLFYATWGIDLLPLAMMITCVAWGAGLLMESRLGLKEDPAEAATPPGKRPRRPSPQKKKRNRIILWLAALVLVGILCYSKAQQRLTGIALFEPVVAFVSGIQRSVIALFDRIPVIRETTQYGAGWDVAVLELLGFRQIEGLTMALKGGMPRYTWIVPLGLSYYTLSLVGYLADIYWGKEKPEKNYFRLLLFVLYFPKILEGPISKYRTVAPQLFEGHPFSYERVKFGLQRAVWGCFKKLVIADRVAGVVTSIFSDYASRTGSEFLVGAILGAVQLYCDFSGCMDIALGVSECYGITLEENFKRPFSSRTAAEFWRKWHMTLGTWFKDYVYMPLAVSPKLMKVSGWLRKKLNMRVAKAFMTAVPLSVVWILTGLWHGTGANYLLWGVYWGAILIVSSIFDPEIKALTRKLKIRTDSRGFRFFQVARTALLFVISRLITLPASRFVIKHVFATLFRNFAPGKLVDGSLLNMGISGPQWVVLLLAVALVAFIGHKQEKGVKIRQWIAQRPVLVRWGIYYAVVFAILIFGAYGAGYDASTFVYMRF